MCYHPFTNGIPTNSCSSVGRNSRRDFKRASALAEGDLLEEAAEAAWALVAEVVLGSSKRVRFGEPLLLLMVDVGVLAARL